MCFTLCTFDSLGVTVNPHNMVLEPTQDIEFLGAILNSVDMTATLTPMRKKHIKAQGLLPLNKDVVSLFWTPFFIGMAVPFDPTVVLAPLRHKYLEIICNRGLACYHGNYSSPVLLDNHARVLIIWWVNNVDYQVVTIQSPPTRIVFVKLPWLVGVQ